MFKSQIYRSALSTFRGLGNGISGLAGRTSRISSVTARNLATTVLVGCAYASGQTLTQLYSFGSNSHDGVDPQAGVVFDNAGNLFGTASSGRISDHGMVYELSRGLGHPGHGLKPSPNNSTKAPARMFRNAD